MKTLSYIFLLVSLSLMAVSCTEKDRSIRVTDNYYLMKNENRQGYYLYYKLAGKFVERVPRRVLEYGVDDNFLVVKCVANDQIELFIIDRKKDTRDAAPADYLLGPYSPEQFNLLDYQMKKRIPMRNVEM